MTIIVFLALSVWASFIFGLNVHKQVSLVVSTVKRKLLMV